MYNKNPYANYKEQSVLTMTPGELLLTLYDEAIKSLSAAKVHIEEKSIEKTHNDLMKSQRIVKYLSDVLNNDIAISKELNRMYEYVLFSMQQANVKKDVKHVDDALTILRELRVTFEECDKKARMEQFSGNRG